MRAVAMLAALAALSVPPVALAQTTLCSTIGQTVSCNTTPAPQPNAQLQNGMTAFGAALGERIHEAREARAAQQTQEQVANAQIAQFAADPAHPYFGIVRFRMSDIIRTGRAADLQTAYDMAVRESPEVQSLAAPGTPH